MTNNRYKISTLPHKAARRAESAEQVMVKNAVVRPKKFLLWCLLGVSVLVAVIFNISTFIKGVEYKNDPRITTFSEFYEGFNKAMQPDGIYIGEDMQWSVSGRWYDTPRCKIILPDSSEAPCYMSFRGGGPVIKAPIITFALRFSQEQADYVVHTVRGVLDVFYTQLDEKDEAVREEILELCKTCFDQEPFEKTWGNVADSMIEMYSDGPDSVVIAFYSYVTS